MRTKNKMQNYLKLGITIIGFIFLIISCQNDDIVIEQQHIGKNPNEVSIEFFENETKINNIKSFAKKSLKGVNNKNNQISFSDFIINTEQIYQCILENDNISFSFYIEPVIETSPLHKYNLVIKQNDMGEWQSSIYKLEVIYNDNSNYAFSSIDKILSTNELPSNVNKSGWTLMYGTTYTFHCTGTGDCSDGVCDMCSQCVTTSVTYQYVYIAQETDNSLTEFNFNSGGGGGGGSFDNEEEDDGCYDVVENISQGININLASLDNSELQNTIEQPINIMTSERLLKDKFQATAKYFQNLNPSNSTLASNSPLAETSQMLAEVSNSEGLSIDDLLFMWNKTKEVFNILSPHSLQIATLGDIDNLNQILTVIEIETVETNLLIVSAFSSLKQMFNDHWPQNAEEWSEFGEFIVTVLKELVPELIPGVAEVLAIKNAINDFNSGDYSSGSTELGLALVGVFPVGKAIKSIAKIAKGFRVVVRLTKSFRKAKKMTQAITGSLDDALVHWNKLGCKGSSSKIRVLDNASEAQGKSYFDLLTKNGVDITPFTAPPGLIVKKIPDNSTITFRNTASNSPNTNATIDFNGGNYNSDEIKKLKFNN